MIDTTGQTQGRNAFNNGSGISVNISRAGGDTISKNLEYGATVQDAVNDLGIESTETLWLNGSKAHPSAPLQDGAMIQIVGKRKGGLR